MAPGATAGRGRTRQNQFFNIGHEGRKTGITLKELGERDEHGLEPMDNLFSSPEKPAERPNGSKSARSARKQDATLSSSDMDIPDSTIPEPTEVRTGQKSARTLPPPRSRSPIKTHLGSPPKKGHLFQKRSSPANVPTPTSGRSKAIARRLDFQANTPQTAERTPVKRTPAGKLPNGVKSLQPPPYIYGEAEDEDGQDGEDDSVQPVHYSDDLPSDEEPEPIEDTINDEKSPEPPKATESAIKKGRGRPPKNKTAETLSKSRAQKRPSPEPVEDEPPGKKQKSNRPPKNASKDKSKAPNRTKSEPTRKPRPGVPSPATVKHMPPLPRRSRGLFIKRREDLADAGLLTRSGRVSIKPLAYWKGETVEYEPDEDSLAARTVIRVDETTPEKRRKTATIRGKGRNKRQQTEEESEEEAEPWEAEPGRIHGDVRIWDPTDPTGLEAQEQEEEIALSAAAIITRDIPGSSFKFAKTLTLPFFGSGMVDLPPGGIKKMKNSRKMQMVFFVYEGRVNVIVNDNEFRIGKGGMWQVPRGNFYSIENSHERAARIFFAQGCEVDMQDEQ